jgi:hypothetical protein
MNEGVDWPLLGVPGTGKAAGSCAQQLLGHAGRPASATCSGNPSTTRPFEAIVGGNPELPRPRGLLPDLRPKPGSTPGASPAKASPLAPGSHLRRDLRFAEACPWVAPSLTIPSRPINWISPISSSVDGALFHPHPKNPPVVWSYTSTSLL